MEPGKPKPWAATLTPYRSLSRRGFVTIMAAIAAVNLVAGLTFYLKGAWPVVGYCGLDVALMWYAFRRNFAAARCAECITIEGGEVMLERLAEGRAPQNLRFIRHWLRVELEEDVERELVGRLFLTSHGKRTEIGSFLPPAEKKEFAGVLRAALKQPTLN
jgi:uncharacterized membrane protein